MSSVPRDDLTARARIRDAAVECFGQRGFGVSVRTVAEHAGVSPGLVIHHFGSKGNLREACDTHVRQLVTEAKTESVTGGSQTFLQQLVDVEQYAPLVGYIVRSLQTGGPLAASLFDLFAEDAERYLALGEQAGTITPTRDPAARARWLTSAGLGSLLLHVTLYTPGPDVDFREVMHTWMDEHLLAVLEVYTEPLLADRTWLDSYLAQERDESPTDTA